MVSSMSSDTQIFGALQCLGGPGGYNMALHEAIRDGDVSMHVDTVSQELVNHVGEHLPATPPWAPEPQRYPAGVVVLKGLHELPVKMRRLTNAEKEVRAMDIVKKDLMRLGKLVSGADMNFEAPQIVDYESLTEMTDDKKIEKWTKSENRAAPPETFKGKVQVRLEPINIDLINDFGSRIACRRAVHPTRGPLLKDLLYMIDRVVPGTILEGIGKIRVLYVEEDKNTGLHTRWMTGLNHLPTVVPDEIADWFKHEVQAGVPRNKMARGVFAFGSLVKVIARQGLNLVDGDQVRAFIFGRWQQLDPITRNSMYRGRL